MAIICVATLGAAIMITVDLPFTRLAEWVNTDETRGTTHQSFIRGGFVPWYSPLPLYTFYFYLFIYFYFTCHTIIKIAKNKEKVEKRSGKET